jgi:hypothetical protein
MIFFIRSLISPGSIVKQKPTFKSPSLEIKHPVIAIHLIDCFLNWYGITLASSIVLYIRIIGILYYLYTIKHNTYLFASSAALPPQYLALSLFYPHCSLLYFLSSLWLLLLILIIISFWYLNGSQIPSKILLILALAMWRECCLL